MNQELTLCQTIKVGCVAPEDFFDLRIGKTEIPTSKFEDAQRLEADQRRTAIGVIGGEVAIGFRKPEEGVSDGNTTATKVRCRSVSAIHVIDHLKT